MKSILKHFSTMERGRGRGGNTNKFLRVTIKNEKKESFQIPGRRTYPAHPMRQVRTDFKRQ